MTKQDFLKKIEIYQIAYRTKLPNSELKLWYEELQDYSCEDLEQAIRRCIQTSKYVPTIAEVLEKINKQVVNKKNNYNNYDQRQYPERFF